MKPNLQHAIERVERPGGSHEGVGRKKMASWSSSHFADRGIPLCLALFASQPAMEEAAVNRLATSITRLTLSQVTTGMSKTPRYL